jgi:hypothetical protein
MQVSIKDPALQAFLKSFINPKMTAPKWHEAEKEANHALVNKISKSHALADFNATLSPTDKRDEEIWDAWERMLNAE